MGTLRRTRRRLAPFFLLGALCFTATGCGAALYGPVLLALLLSGKNNNTIRTTFPDVAVASIQAPKLASVTVGAQVTDANGHTGPGVTGVNFPGTFGFSQSDRGAGLSTGASDTLLVAINGDAAQSITPGVAPLGTQVAAVIQAAVRALKPSSANVPAEAYTLFTCTFDANIQQYVLTSGVPGPSSAVVVNPKGTTANNGPTAAEVATAANLRLGVANNGLERVGAESVSYVVFNHGTDVMPSGMPVSLFLSKSKTIDSSAILIRQDTTPGHVEVSVARRFTSRNQAPPKPVVDSSLTPGQYYLIIEANPGGNFGGEKSTTLADNVRTFSKPIEIATVSSATGSAPAAASATDKSIDLAPADFTCSISGVAGHAIQCNVQVENFGGAVAAAQPISIDVVLAQNGTFVPPTTVSDPAGALAGFFVNPVDFRVPSSLVLNPAGPAGQPLSLGVSGDTVTATWDGAADLTPVASITAAVAQSPVASLIIDLPADGVGSPATQSLTQLVKAANAATTPLLTGGRIIVRRPATFQPAPVEETVQDFQFDAVLPTAFPSNLLPQKFFAFARVTPATNTQSVVTGADAVRTAQNYLRIVSPSTAVFNGGIFLPTGDPNDFQPFEAVIGRPTNSGLVQGHQAIFQFTIPQTGISLDECQLLMAVQATQFDPHLELLDSTGHLVASSDDSALGLEPLIYTPALATSGNPTFYAVVSNASFTDQTQAGSASFTLVISVNSRQPGDPALVAAIDHQDFFVGANTPVARNPALGITENDKLVEFTLAEERTEVMFVLPALARVRFKSSPIFAVGVGETITQFVEGSPVTQVAFQAEVDPGTLSIIYRPSGGTIDTSFLLPAGIYTFDFNSSGGPDPTSYILEVDTDYVPAGTQ